MNDEYRVKVSVSNNLLIRAIENAGYKTQSDFARAIDFSPTRVNCLCGLREAPIKQNGEFTDLANAVMEALGACPTDLWSSEQLTMKLNSSSSWTVMGKEELSVLMNGEQKSLLDGIAQQQLKTKMDEARKILTFREQTVIGMRFDDSKTLEECGKELKMSRERIRQMEARALRKLRQHAGRTDLESFVN